MYGSERREGLKEVHRYHRGDEFKTVHILHVNQNHFTALRKERAVISSPVFEFNNLKGHKHKTRVGLSVSANPSFTNKTMFIGILDADFSNSSQDQNAKAVVSKNVSILTTSNISNLERNIVAAIKETEKKKVHVRIVVPVINPDWEGIKQPAKKKPAVEKPPVPIDEKIATKAEDNHKDDSDTKNETPGEEDLNIPLPPHKPVVPLQEDGSVDLEGWKKVMEQVHQYQEATNYLRYLSAVAREESQVTLVSYQPQYEDIMVQYDSIPVPTLDSLKNDLREFKKVEPTPSNLHKFWREHGPLHYLSTGTKKFRKAIEGTPVHTALKGIRDGVRFMFDMAFYSVGAFGWSIAAIADNPSLLTHPGAASMIGTEFPIYTEHSAAYVDEIIRSGNQTQEKLTRKFYNFLQYMDDHSDKSSTPYFIKHMAGSPYPGFNINTDHLPNNEEANWLLEYTLGGTEEDFVSLAHDISPAFELGSYVYGFSFIGKKVMTKCAGELFSVVKTLPIKSMKRSLLARSPYTDPPFPSHVYHARAGLPKQYSLHKEGAASTGLTFKEQLDKKWRLPEVNVNPAKEKTKTIKPGKPLKAHEVDLGTYDGQLTNFKKKLSIEKRNAIANNADSVQFKIDIESLDHFREINQACSRLPGMFDVKKIQASGNGFTISQPLSNIPKPSVKLDKSKKAAKVYAGKIRGNDFDRLQPFINSAKKEANKKGAHRLDVIVDFEQAEAYEFFKNAFKPQKINGGKSNTFRIPITLDKGLLLEREIPLPKVGHVYRAQAGIPGKPFTFPDKLPAFPDAKPVKSTKSVEGGGKKRKMWETKKHLLAGDTRHGLIDLYRKKGKKEHLGKFDPYSGDMVSGPKKGKNLR